MIRLLVPCALFVMVTACAVPIYEPEPTSPQAWQRRQDSIERREAERIRLCRITQEDDPRHEQLCRGVEGGRS